METIQIKYFTDRIDRLAYVGGKSNWIGLRAAEDIILKVGEFKLIPPGVAMELPKGYEAYIVSRSSTSKSFKVIQADHRGVTDETYCGGGDQRYFPASAMRDTIMETDDRIRQFHIMERQPALQFNEVEALVGQGRGGTGSTGTQQLSHEGAP